MLHNLDSILPENSYPIHGLKYRRLAERLKDAERELAALSYRIENPPVLTIYSDDGREILTIERQHDREN